MGMSCQMLSKTWKAHEVFLHADTNGLKSGKMKPVGWAWFTWWLIPLSKWVITGLTLLIPFITGVITYNPLTKYIRWLMSYHKVQKQLDCLTAARNPWICFSATNPPATNLDVFAAVKWGVQGAKPQWYPGLPPAFRFPSYPNVIQSWEPSPSCGWFWIYRNMTAIFWGHTMLRPSIFLPEIVTVAGWPPPTTCCRWSVGTY